MVEVRDLVIEVTRRCNMQCPHCARGEAQNLDINLEYVATLFEKIDIVSTLTITGGEPSLVPEIINAILDLAIKYGVEINGFYLVTNAKKITMEFVTVLIRLWDECADTFSFGDDFPFVQYSNDIYHDFIDTQQEGFKLLRALRFVSPRNEKDNADYNLIGEGRAIDNYTCNRDLTPDKFLVEEYTDHWIIEDGSLYLNAKGNLIAGCDWSYESQDDPENDRGCRICHVNDFTVEKILDMAEAIV